MKRSLLVALIILTCTLGTAKGQNDLPNSHVNVGAGMGMVYGGIGVKTVIGYRNSGLLIGLGYLPTGVLGYEIGGQLSSKSFYMNLGYGISGIYQVNNDPVETVKSGNFMVGYMISLDKMKNVFLDLSVGHTIGAPTVQIGPFEENQGGITWGIGVGIRLAKKKE